jgi:multicomponent Na+:H+ antiporter subunit B
LTIGSVFESLGALLFISVAILGILLTGVFFANFLAKGIPFHLVSAGIIPICNIAIAIKVGAGLFSIILALAAMKYVIED